MEFGVRNSNRDWFDRSNNRGEQRNNRYNLCYRELQCQQDNNCKPCSCYKRGNRIVHGHNGYPGSIHKRRKLAERQPGYGDYNDKRSSNGSLNRHIGNNLYHRCGMYQYGNGNGNQRGDCDRRYADRMCRANDGTYRRDNRRGVDHYIGERDPRQQYGCCNGS